MNNHLLEIKELKTYFRLKDRTAKAVDGVSFSINQGEILGIIGESGSGKSVTALSIMQLIQSPPGEIAAGEIIFNNRDLLAMSAKEMRKIRGNDISMIFQEPMTSLNPVFTVGDQISETIRQHQPVGRKKAKAMAVELLGSVGVPSPERRIDDYPHRLSGGLRQRVMIAQALSCRPKLLIADEPTTALDVTIQAQILDLLREIRNELGMGIAFITHDLAVVSEIADTVAVMYAGQIVEYGTTAAVIDNPLHPYTRALYQSVPHIDDDLARDLYTIPGSVPSPVNFPAGCRFHPRCSCAVDDCSVNMPKLLPVAKGHTVRCSVVQVEKEKR